MLTYGVIGGFGLGLIYLPAVVAVGYYFESKRALATGISVSINTSIICRYTVTDKGYLTTLYKY